MKTCFNCPFCNGTGIEARGFMEIDVGHVDYEVKCRICEEKQ